MYLSLKYLQFKKKSLCDDGVEQITMEGLYLLNKALCIFRGFLTLHEMNCYYDLQNDTAI